MTILIKSWATDSEALDQLNSNTGSTFQVCAKLTQNICIVHVCLIQLIMYVSRRRLLVGRNQIKIKADKLHLTIKLIVCHSSSCTVTVLNIVFSPSCNYWLKMFQIRFVEKNKRNFVDCILCNTFCKCDLALSLHSHLFFLFTMFTL